MAFQISSFPDLLAEASAAATVVGGIVGFLVGEAAKSRRSLEDLALGAAIGAFAGCAISIAAYRFADLIK
jgi:hypothetical protein